MQIKFLISPEFNSKFSNFEPNLFKNISDFVLRLRLRGWVGCFYGSTYNFFPNSEKIIERWKGFVWKVVQFEDKSTSCQYFRDRKFLMLKISIPSSEDASQNCAEAYEHSLLSIFLPFFDACFTAHWTPRCEYLESKPATSHALEVLQKR